MWSKILGDLGKEPVAADIVEEEQLKDAGVWAQLCGRAPIKPGSVFLGLIHYYCDLRGPIKIPPTIDREEFETSRLHFTQWAKGERKMSNFTVEEIFQLFRGWSYNTSRGKLLYPADAAAIIDILQTEDLLPMPETPHEMKTMFPVRISRDGKLLKFPQGEEMLRILREGHEVFM